MITYRRVNQRHTIKIRMNMILKAVILCFTRCVNIVAVT